ncbi:hypothetical protein FQN54_002528 [Arachnomyces sp. PD_36]|nr:hypothetical protein FQN54_002528 [Arachnomyces sp. PD_36]
MASKHEHSNLALRTGNGNDKEAIEKKTVVAAPQSLSPNPGASEELTPPVTPVVGPNSAVPPKPLKSKGEEHTSPFLSIPEAPAFSIGSTQAPEDRAAIYEFTHDIDLQFDEEGKPIVYGRGAWSIVYQAFSALASSPSPFVSTPPLSPISPNRFLAVKSPMRRDAHPVLKEEARILTRLLYVPGKEKHVVPFHGFISHTHTIIMTAVPLSLSTYIDRHAAAARKTFSTHTMFQPVIGMAQWLALARSLVEGLIWLHGKAHVIHGDIKPHNILLNPLDSALNQSEDNINISSADTLYADFSSAHEILPRGKSSSSPVSTVSALTPPYAAPEFLSVSLLKSSEMVPTTTSDVFSLAVTLIAAATGDLLLYPGTNSMQRLALSQDGHRVLEHVRAGDNGARVPRNGVVDRVLTPAVAKIPGHRIEPEAWLEIIAREEEQFKSQSATTSTGK